MLQLLSDITKKELQTRVENINIPGEPFRMHVQYRNMETMYIRIINAAEFEKLNKKNRYEENYWEDVTALPYISSFTQVLPQTNDHQQHAVEIKMNALQPGRYAVLASSGAGFRDGTDKMIVQ